MMIQCLKLKCSKRPVSSVDDHLNPAGQEYVRAGEDGHKTQDREKPGGLMAAV